MTAVSIRAPAAATRHHHYFTSGRLPSAVDGDQDIVSKIRARHYTRNRLARPLMAKASAVARLRTKTKWSTNKSYTYTGPPVGTEPLGTLADRRFRLRRPRARPDRKWQIEIRDFQNRNPIRDVACVISTRAVRYWQLTNFFTEAVPYCTSKLTVTRHSTTVTRSPCCSCSNMLLYYISYASQRTRRLVLYLPMLLQLQAAY